MFQPVIEITPDRLNGEHGSGLGLWSKYQYIGLSNDWCPLLKMKNVIFIHHDVFLLLMRVLGTPSVSKQVMEEHGGDILVRSGETDAGGSTFTMILKLHSRAERVAPPGQRLAVDSQYMPPLSVTSKHSVVFSDHSEDEPTILSHSMSAFPFSRKESTVREGYQGADRAPKDTVGSAVEPKEIAPAAQWPAGGSPARRGLLPPIPIPIPIPILSSSGKQRPSSPRKSIPSKSDGEEEEEKESSVRNRRRYAFEQQGAVTASVTRSLDDADIPSSSHGRADKAVGKLPLPRPTGALIKPTVGKADGVHAVSASTPKAAAGLTVSTVLSPLVSASPSNSSLNITASHKGRSSGGVLVETRDGLRRDDRTPDDVRPFHEGDPHLPTRTNTSHIEHDVSAPLLISTDDPTDISNPKALLTDPKPRGMQMINVCF